MQNKLFRLWNDATYKRLGLALAVSALLHLALVKGLGLQYTGWWGEPETSTITMQAVLAPSKPAAKLAVPATPAPNPAANKPSKPEPPPEPEVVAEAPNELANASPPQAPEAAPETAPEAIPTETTKPEEEAVAQDSAEPPTQSEQTVNDEDTALSPSLTSVETVFSVTKGSATGVIRNRYQILPDGSYILTSEAEAEGLLSLFLGKLKQQSEGMVTQRGLRPSRYLYQYGDNADKTQRASFDWQTGTLTMQNGKKTKTAPLEEGTQDLLSFMYQFMFVPPLEQMQLSIANGKRLSTYAYDFEGEETLSTKIGELRTIHIFRSGDDSDEKTELWLALDYHNLPVKMRKTEKDGSVIEQIATRISIQPSGSETVPEP